MKTRINHFILFAFFALLTFSSCQDETVDINNPDDQETIQPDSQLASLISRTTSYFGASDNILDGSSCLSVELPVTIIVSDITIVIEDEDDLELLEDLFDDLDDDADFLDFIFPITIILSDYTEIIIENEDQLENLIDDCEDNEDDSIECVDFVYPISFSVFNSEFDLVETVVVESDEALYNFLDDLEDDENALIVSLNYPVTLEYANGDTIEVNSNAELVNAIEAAEDDCDDDDDDCEGEELDEILEECSWEVYLYTNNDLENLSGPFIFDFNENGTLHITGVLENPYETTWELTETDNGLELNIASLWYYEEQFGNWRVVECDDDDLEFIHLTVDGTGLLFDQECEDDLDCSVVDISEALEEECFWELETNLIDSVVPIYVYFTANGQVLTADNGNTETQIGVWELTQIGGNIFVLFTLQQGFNDLTGQWQVVECEDDELYLVNGDNYIELEQECDLFDDEVFDCFDDFELVSCLGPNNEAEFNLSADTIGLLDCEYSFIPSFHISEADAEAGSNAIVETESYWSMSGQVYLRIEAESGNFEVFTIYLNTEECNYFECFGNYSLTVCDQDDGIADGLAQFSLNLIFDNCPNDDAAYTFHETLIDAQNDILALPSTYTNVSNPQTVYSRVSLAGDPSVFEIFSHDLIVQDCNESCSEEDVDAILVECIWNITNYNGSDNLAVWNFDFESTSNIVVIYTNNETIDATWTTSQITEGVVIEFSNVAGPNIQAITGSWLVVECTTGQLILHDVNNSNNEIVLDRTCD
ncbi:hypothetical protein [Winogradskyella flava]|uniref:Lipocalin-like domain-containing protein n=1 Tax=Winogradskyella flava TaxID=1884876 RepID=A0A842IX18_9FLAO|nr:hypothetical protein [Winogradskyella flava]MBC2846659.1 hypothetical protein [Winogradskyella flava]